MKQTFIIKGMSCAACSAAVEKAVSHLKGLKEAKVNLLLNTLSADYDEKILSQADIIKAVENAGYGASVKGNSAKNTEPQKTFEESTKENTKAGLIFCFILLVPLMYLSMGGMFGLPYSSTLPRMTSAILQLLLTMPAVFINYRFFTKGFKALFRLTPTMDSLIATGAGAAFIYGIYAVLAMSYYLSEGQTQAAEHFYHNLYFESAAVILTVVSLGKFLEQKAKRKTSAAIEKLIKLAPKTAEIERNGQTLTVNTQDLQTGDIIIIKSGQSLPADGTIIQGSGFLDESFITGESLPAEKTAGQKVICATINTDGYFKYRAERTGNNTTLAQIIKLTEEANTSKPEIAELADKISAVFVPAVILIAVICAAVWFLAGYPFAFALNFAICVLVISCPCALGLATPAAIMCATGSGARNGILIKNIKSLQTGLKADSIILDKTGTLTEGKPSVTDIIAEDKNLLLKIAAGLESLSSHPLAKAITAYAQQNGIKPCEVSSFTYSEGLGIKGIYQNQTVSAGNLKFMEAEHYDFSAFNQKYKELSAEGKTVLFFTYAGKILGIAALADKIKATSAQAVKRFKQRGLTVYMLTGDNKNAAAYIAKQAGIENFKAEMLPSDKVKFIKDLQLKGRKIVMTGDGINDAPALACADLAIAIGAGSDIAAESADIVLMHSDLNDAVYALDLSRATIRNIKQNLFWALFYNAAGIPLAAGVFYKALGWQLSPMFAATAMALSSLFVVTNALRLTKFNPVKIKEEKVIITLYIEGMACAHCSARVQNALQALGAKASVDLKAKTATVETDGSISAQQLKDAVEKAGYRVTKTI